MRKSGMLLVAVVALGAAAPARAADRFDGSCTGLQGAAAWPEHPLVLEPIDMLLLARFSGGECTGTLNGREIVAEPATASARLRGPQSCGGGITSGRFAFKVAGRKITGRMTYRRTASRVNATWEGDSGGTALVLVRAMTSVVGQDHPLAGVPVVGPAISGPVSTQDALTRCAAEGLPSMPIYMDRMATLPSLSG